MHRLVRVGVLAASTAAAALLPATAKMAAIPPAQEAIATSQATGEFEPAAHPTARIVLGEAGFATMTGREGALECLPGARTVQLNPSAITVDGSIVHVDFGAEENVQAVIVGKYNTTDTAYMNAGADHGNAVGTADIKFTSKFVDGGKNIVDGDVEVKLCVLDPEPNPTSSR